MTYPSTTLRLIELIICGCRVALPLDCVQRLLPGATPIPLRGVPRFVLGALKVDGELVTLVDLGRRLGLPDAPALPLRQLLLVELAGFRTALLVDRIVGVTERSVGALPADSGGAPFLRGVLRLADGLCLVLDPRGLLFDGERAALARSLTGVGDALR